MDHIRLTVTVGVGGDERLVLVDPDHRTAAPSVLHGNETVVVDVVEHDHPIVEIGVKRPVILVAAFHVCRPHTIDGYQAAFMVFQDKEVETLGGVHEMKGDSSGPGRYERRSLQARQVRDDVWTELLEDTNGSVVVDRCLGRRRTENAGQ